MITYIIRRLILLPITLFSIVLVNFVIINLAPGEPVTIAEISEEGQATRRADQAVASGSDERYLQFREFYGLTLPILFNNWPWLDQAYVNQTLTTLAHEKETMTVREYDALRVTFGDQARFLMPLLLQAMDDPSLSKLAAHFFVRGGTKQAYLGPALSAEKRAFNSKVGRDNSFLRASLNNVEALQGWYKENPSPEAKWWWFFKETRFAKYMSRVLVLDFGTLRNDSNKTVTSEVTKRFKYSLTLAVFPMLITFVLCQLLGFTMAFYRGHWPDFTLNLLCLVFYAIPVFVVAPFLIEKVALNQTFPFTEIPIPISGFTSQDAIYDAKTSIGRLFDTLQHIIIPLIAIMYGSLAAQARLSRTAVLEVLRQDYVRTAWAKGVAPFTILWKHVGRNAGITIVTSIAGSLGVVLGGSLIVETLFEINGFGKFFYDAILNRDYNVIMFSTFAGSLLTLLGYLVADIAYTLLDPRISLE